MCHSRGEGRVEGRLLYCGDDEWIHVNCALWSCGVFEDGAGALQNIYEALVRSRSIRCSLCGELGATLNCCSASCVSVYHFPCALRHDGVVFLEDKRTLCVQHANELAESCGRFNRSDFQVSRCVYVDQGGRSGRTALRPAERVQVTIGSLSVTSLGQIRPEVYTGNHLNPVGYECRRRFWSTKEPWRMTTYTCRSIYVAGKRFCCIFSFLLSVKLMFLHLPE